jgi:sec-independent protein translocase protein TatA
MFDPSAPHIIILLVVVLLLFGSTRLPGAAEALGKSMRIFKREARKLNDDDEKPAEATVTQVNAVHQPASQPVLPNTAAAPAAPAAPADSTQQQIQELQRQIQDLQAQRDQQPL